MALLNDQIRKEVTGMLADMPAPVTLKVFTQPFECEYCKETRELAEEVAGLSERLSVEVYELEKDVETAKAYGIDKIPAIAIVGAKDYGIRLYGIPSGYEFGSLIEDIKLASEGQSGLAQASKDLVAKLKEPVHIQVFITPT
jgi:glutaredoxin-like protein